MHDIQTIRGARTRDARNFASDAPSRCRCLQSQCGSSSHAPEGLVVIDFGTDVGLDRVGGAPPAARAGGRRHGHHQLTSEGDTGVLGTLAAVVDTFDPHVAIVTP